MNQTNWRTEVAKVGVLPYTFPFFDTFARVEEETSIPRLLTAAIAYQESLSMYMERPYEALVVISYDGGRGLMQLTSSAPRYWRDAYTSVTYAVNHFIIPAAEYWVQNLPPPIPVESLIRCIGASYNAGLQNAINGHSEGDVDKYTTSRYGSRLWENMRKIAKADSRQ